MTYDQLNKTYYEEPSQSTLTNLINVEIGDSQQSDFYPQVKIMRWDNEVNFSARLVNDEVNPLVVESNNVISWQGEKVSANMYDIDDGYEFEVILNEQPATNTVQFTLQTKGLDFYYQDVLTDDEVANGLVRPDNIIGSYAVYASGDKINYEGENEYKSGKVGHIFRPRIVDAEGTEVWGDLNIDTDNGLLTVTIPQPFLDSAVYPIHHAAGLTFGYAAVGQTTTNQQITWNSRCSLLDQHTAVAGETLTKITGYFKMSNAAGVSNTVAGALYSVSGGIPSKRLSAGADMIVTSTTPSWVSTLTLNQQMQSGTSYAICIGNWRDGSTYDVTTYLDTTGNGYECLYGALPETWSALTTNAYSFSVYATYIAPPTVANTVVAQTPNIRQIALWHMDGLVAAAGKLASASGTGKTLTEVGIQTT